MPCALCGSDGGRSERFEQCLLVTAQWSHREVASLHAMAADHLDVGAEPELRQAGDRSPGHHDHVDSGQPGERADRLGHARQQRRVGGMPDDRGKDAVDVEADQPWSWTGADQASDVDGVVVVIHVDILLSRR